MTKHAILLPCLLLLALGTASAHPAPSEFAYVQFIHNIPTSGPVDLYVDGELFWDDASYQTATAFLVVAAGDLRLDLVAADAPDASAPLWSGTLTVQNRVNCIVAFGGGVGAEAASLMMNEAVRLKSDPAQAEFFFVYGATDIGEIDIRLLDPVTNKPETVLANNINFGHVSGYIGLTPFGYNVELSSADNSKQYEVFWLNLNSQGGRTFTILVSGSGASARDGLTLIGFDVNGAPLRASLITATETTAAPERFVLHGNYPNPFNPSTTLTLDLPAAAHVSVEVFDVMGQRVHQLPPHPMAAGPRQTLRLDARHLASGLYLYRVTARTAEKVLVRTGRMTLLR